ncbi:MAG: hypothetical protein HKUEN02_13810 [Anaerolineaceae bacterium]|nr:MAG: hypothetical protein HKUEN02_13810 [Anaerolineaceae bacterium]
MKSIRRLYFYAVAAVSLEATLWGLINLLRSIFRQGLAIGDTTLLAQALSLILVGTPIFLIHWLWAQKTAAKESEENEAMLRAIFLYGALLGTLIPVAQNLLALISRTALESAHSYARYAIAGGGSQTLADNAIAILSNLLIAAYFFRVLQTNWNAISEKENFAGIRRLYRFAWMAYGLALTVYGAQGILNFMLAWRPQTLSADEPVLNAIVMLMVGAPIWYAAWNALQSALSDKTERDSYIRLVILYALTLIGAFVVLSCGGSFMHQILMKVLGVQEIAQRDFMANISAPISLGTPFGLIWAYYGMWLNRQFAFEEDETLRAGKRRLLFYILAGAGLIVSFASINVLIAALLDVFAVAQVDGGYFASSLSASLAGLSIGLPLWLKTWRPMQAQAMQEQNSSARRSVVRKFYMYFALFACVVGGMTLASVIIFYLISAVLTAEFGALWNDIRDPLQALILFAIVFGYHLHVLRKDARYKNDAQEEAQARYRVLILDRDGSFGVLAQKAFAERAPAILTTIVDANTDLAQSPPAQALVLSDVDAFEAPSRLATWMKSFGGARLIVGESEADVFWSADFEQATDIAKALAAGRTLRLSPAKAKTSAWMYVVYVFAGLFACQFSALAVWAISALIFGS